MTTIKILTIAFAMIITAPIAFAGDTQNSDAEPFHVNAYLCETPQYAVAFAAAVSKGEEDELAKDVVGRTARREVCGRYIGVAFVQEQKLILSDGIMYKLTALRFTEDDRIAWLAELTFAAEGRSSWHL
jgi:hypothetical protein